ncbi:MAG: rhomboid family intramembrane serine protease [Gemmatimonadota bacterium]|nr:rhomboid family intramembrane serine protease [Gemmatimonadota bacterium]
MTDEHQDRISASEAAAPRRPWVTRGIVVAALGLYFIQASVLAPGDVESALGFATPDLGHRWWTLLTFTLVHDAPWPLALNSTVLLVFGSRLERSWGSGEFVRFYLTCALGAWITHLIGAPSDVVLAGAAGPAMGVILAFASLSGGEPPLRIGAISVSAGWLTVGGTALILAVGIAAGPPDAAAAFLAHAGGIVAAWAYLRTAGSLDLKRLREGMSQVPDEPDEMPRAVPRAHPRAQRHEDDIVAQSNATVAREAAARRATHVHDGDPAGLDELLDKISRQGLDSLTLEERRRLDEASRRLRGG